MPPVLIGRSIYWQRPKSQSRVPIADCADWVELVPGVSDTPRSTSPNCAVRTVVNSSLAGSVVAAILSVIVTSLFGSAPWSPPPLTVAVMAQIVTVPSELTRPVMLRRPSVAGDHGRPVAALLPVG